MASQPQSQWVVRNTGVPRTFGLLNVIFGVMLLLGGIGSVAWVLMAPTLEKAMRAQNLAKAKAEREARIAELKKQEAAAKTEEEKEQLRTEREAAESVPEPPDMTDVTIWDTYADPRYRAYFWREAGLGIVLNIAMIVAGAGLLATAEWGRRLAIGVAWGKIIQLVAMAVITLTVIVPMTAENTQRMFDTMEAKVPAQPGARVPRGFSKEVVLNQAILVAVGAVGFTVVGSIYPGLAIWFLTRPRTRAACAGPAGAARRRAGTQAAAAGSRSAGRDDQPAGADRFGTSGSPRPRDERLSLNSWASDTSAGFAA
jgi:hypothetical protein